MNIGNIFSIVKMWKIATKTPNKTINQIIGVPPKALNPYSLVFWRCLYISNAGIIHVQIVATAPAYPMAVINPNGKSKDNRRGGINVANQLFVLPNLSFLNWKRSAKKSKTPSPTPMKEDKIAAIENALSACFILSVFITLPNVFNSTSMFPSF